MMPVAILCGGKGTRLSPLTDHLPKALVDICGKPFLIRQIELLKRKGYTDLVLCVGHLSDQIEAAIGDGSHFGVTVRYSHDAIPGYGTARALIDALPLLGDRFFVTYGDSYLDCDYAAIEAEARRQDQPLSTTYKGVDYGLMVLTPAALEPYRTSMVSVAYVADRECTFLAMSEPWQEIGSHDGRAALCRYLSRRDATDRGDPRSVDRGHDGG